MQYIVRRILLLVPTALAVIAIVFVLVRVVPGDVVTLLLNDQSVTPEAAEALRRNLGLRAPVPVQFAAYTRDLLRGDLGTSIWTDRRVASEIASRLPITLELVALTSIFSTLFGIAGGVLAAIARNRWPDHLLRAIAVGGLSLPGFWLATLAIVLPAVWWRYTPPLTYVSPLTNPTENLRQFVVPALIMSLSFGAVLMRMTRTMMLEVLECDYVRTARAKGLPERRIVFDHALRNALVPVVTILGTQTATLLGGTVVFEQIFNLKGIGSYMFEAVSRRDYPVIQSVNVLLALTVLSINLLVDLAYLVLDPRTAANR